MAKPTRKNTSRGHTIRTPQAPVPSSDVPGATENPWLKLALYGLQHNRLEDARTAIERGLEQAPRDARMLQLKGQLHLNLGEDTAAEAALQQSLQLDSSLPDTHFFLSFLYKQKHHLDKALATIEQALTLSPAYPEYLFHKSTVLAQLNRHAEALAILHQLLEQHPDSGRYWNNAGVLYNNLGEPAEARRCFEHALQLEPDNLNAHSNLLTSLHYDPTQSRDAIFDACREWERRHPVPADTRPAATDRQPGKRLRIGMISDGFRVHPVGRMIIAALEQLPAHAYEFFAYSSCGRIDAITKRFQAISHYRVTIHLSDEELAAQIRQDEIDILIDLAGYNSGSRVPVLAMQPAPLQVKWVGGLINTTGLSSVDYLITDRVESPAGDDPYYTERLIRMPGDYICYEMPAYMPEAAALPARSNGHITLGCFNNPMKLNPVVLGQWGQIMQTLEHSVLLLKGAEFNSDALCQQVRQTLVQQGIASERILIEGFSPHPELLASYNRVDIALDPWPYSGGLTTCEALAMGVPVVTLPGPTFAGRHSATHLVNAGMPELVTNSWDEYRARVIELASDLDSLATIRAHLRSVLLQSPVCDAATFAGHLHDALRAIWQRHTEDKAPAALSFTEQGDVLFAGEQETTALQHPAAPAAAEQSSFHWQFDGKVIAIDQGGALLKTPVTRQMLDQGTLELLVFDPAGNHTRHGLRQHGACHYYPNVALGDGTPATLYACQSAQRTGTLSPLADEHLPQQTRDQLTLLTKLPIGTLALDKANELPSLDWLVLDDVNDSLAALEHGRASLQQTLLIHARVAFQPTHAGQPNFTEVAHWASRNGFRFYRFVDQDERTPVSQQVIGANRYADELLSATALFVPSHARMHTLTDSQRMKLAYLADGVYGLKGLSYEMLQTGSQLLADAYLAYNTERLKAEKQPHVPTSGKRVTPRIRREPTPVAAPAAQPLAADAFDWPLAQSISVVDIGANPIDGTPPYRSLLDRGLIELVGFEPQTEALKKLNQQKGPRETYLPHAVGDGSKKTLYLCQAEGMTSTLAPNFELLNRFQGYPVWAKVQQEVPVQTRRLDELDAVPPVDWLKIDIQGGELNVFRNAEAKLKDCLVIQTEVNFVPLYQDQPLFADIDQWMRAHGFMLHTLLEQRKRLFAPMVINNQIHQGINQLTTADAVYVRSFDALEQMDEQAITKLACIMHEAYGSYDYALALCNLMRQRSQAANALAARYADHVKNLQVALDTPDRSPTPAEQLLTHQHSYLHQVGWFKSHQSRESITRQGAIPWVTYPFLHFIQSRIQPEFKVFEYGSGNSTLWLSRKAARVVSVEHDSGWYRKMQPQLPDNVDYIHHKLVYGGHYCREILKPEYAGQFDIAFIDGRDRVNCLKHALGALNDSGVVILDNAEREAYAEGSQYLLTHGFRRIDFMGMGPINLDGWSTAVFYRADNCLGL